MSASVLVYCACVCVCVCVCTWFLNFGAFVHLLMIVPLSASRSLPAVRLLPLACTRSKIGENIIV